jgi:hypothetical protein
LFDSEIGCPQDLSRHDEALVPVVAEPLVPLEDAGLLTALALGLSGFGRQPADDRRSPGEPAWSRRG